MDEFQDIVKIIKQLPKVEAPADFSGRIACRIEAGQMDRQAKRAADLSPLPGGPFAGLEQGRSCPLWFIMAGFCYVTLGVLLFYGLGRVGGDYTLARWIAMQPQIAVLVGIIFFTLGVLLFHGKMIVLKAAQHCLFIYIGFVVINGVGMQLKLGVPATVVLLLFYIACGVGLGFFLQETVHRYQQQLNHLT